MHTPPRRASSMTQHAAPGAASSVLRAGLERIVSRCPSAASSSPQCAAVFALVPGGGSTTTQEQWVVRRKVSEEALLAAAGALLVDPTHAVVAGGCLRPVALLALSRGLDGIAAEAMASAAATASASAAAEEEPREVNNAAAASEITATAVRHERACAALGLLLELLPHAEPVAMRYLRSTPPPFARLAGGGAMIDPDAGRHDADADRGGGGGEGTHHAADEKKHPNGGQDDDRDDDESGGGGASSSMMDAEGRRDADDDAAADRDHALLVVRACVRLLRVVGRRLAHRPSAGAGANEANEWTGWDCTPMLRFLRHPDAEIRWTASMALEHVVGLPVEAAARLRARHAGGAERRHAFHEAWEEQCAAVAAERAGAYLEVGPADDSRVDDEDDTPLFGTDLPAAPGHVRVGGVEIRCRPAETSGRTESGVEQKQKRTTRTVMTRGARRNLEAVALALCQGRPLLLEGPAGSGKSATLEEVAAATGNGDFVTLHLDAQTDSKSLLGSYVVGAAPGEFKWQPGALTQAVSKGLWVVIEDVDLAPFEVLAALVPLLEERRLYVPGRAESVPAAEGFHLFGTVTTGGGRSGGSAAAGARADPLAGLWARVALEPPARDEPFQILVGMHPKLKPLAPAMLETLNVAQRICGQGGGALTPGGCKDAEWNDGSNPQGGSRGSEEERGDGDEAMDVDVEEPATPALVTPLSPEDALGGGSRVHAGRPFTLRDLLRWARRLEKLRKPELGLLRKGASGPDSLPPKVRVAAYEEAADVLAGMLPAGPGRRRVLEAMAACWGLGADAAERTDALHKPALQAGSGAVAVGRAMLPAEEEAARAVSGGGGGGGWARTGHAMRILERVAAAVQMTEPVLLVGETGTGKTALVQQLARVTGAPLTVVNLSNQSESADFLGGFRPAGARHLCLPLLPRFRAAFDATFPAAANAEFMTRVVRYAERRKWTHLLHAFRAGVERVAKLAAAAAEEEDAEKKPEEEPEDPAAVSPGGGAGRGVGAKSKRGGGKRRGGKGARHAAVGPDVDMSEAREEQGAPAAKKRRRSLPDALVAEWRAFERDLSTAERACGGGGGGPVFAFVEGALVTALREGRWILLDEINLAPAETLERLGGVLESAHGSVVLSERGDGEAIARHPRFRIFGAMNPATDVGKRDLPAALKHRFTELYAGECEGREDLALLVAQGMSSVPAAPVAAVVDFYLAARDAANTTLLDSADQKPQYSLRTLSRAMEYVRTAAPLYGVQRALYDGFAMSFQTLLQAPSAAILEKLMVKHLLKGTPLKVRDDAARRAAWIWDWDVGFFFQFFFSDLAATPREQSSFRSSSPMSASRLRFPRPVVPKHPAR